MLCKYLYRHFDSITQASKGPKGNGKQCHGISKLIKRKASTEKQNFSVKC